MSGHSKWHTIRHKKAAIDAKRGNAFTKLGKEITVAARMGGGDPNFNASLRTAIANAKTANMPNDNITRAVKRGTGELEGVSYEEITYEGYAPGGVAVIVRTLTDNKNRTVADMRHLFGKYNGSLGESGCVSFLFERKGFITVPRESIAEEKIMEAALEAGADDVRDGDAFWEVITDSAAMADVREALEKAGLKIENAEVTLLPTTTVGVTDEKNAQSILKLMGMLEDHDDVQNVYANFDIPENLMQSIQ